jgi:hypothetical protein
MDDTQPKNYSDQSSLPTPSENNTSYPPPVSDLTTAEIPPPNVAEPMVVMPSTDAKPQFLFYLIFIITVIAFLSVSYLLFQSFTAKKDTSLTSVPTGRPTATPIIVTPSVTPVPIDSAVQKMRTFIDSEKLTDIEANVENTDYSSLTESVNDLDKKLNFSSKK